MTMVTIEVVTASEEDGAVTIDREEQDGARARRHMAHRSKTIQLRDSLVARVALDSDQQSVEEEDTDKADTTKTHISKEGISKVVSSQDTSRVHISKVSFNKLYISKVVFSKADFNKVVFSRTMDITMVSNRTDRKVARIITREAVVVGEGDVEEVVGAGVADDNSDISNTSSLLVLIGICCFTIVFTIFSF